MNDAEFVLKEALTIIRQLEKVLMNALADERTKNEARLLKHLEAQGIVVTDEPNDSDENFEL